MHTCALALRRGHHSTLYSRKTLGHTDSGPAPRTFLLHAILSLFNTCCAPVTEKADLQLYMYVDRPRVYPVSSIYAARYDLNAWIARVLESS